MSLIARAAALAVVLTMAGCAAQAGGDAALAGQTEKRSDMLDYEIGQGEHSVVLSKPEVAAMAEQLRVLVNDPEARAQSGAPVELQARLDNSVGPLLERESDGAVMAGLWTLSSAGAGLRWEFLAVPPARGAVRLMFLAPVQQMDDAWTVGPLVFQRVF